MEVMKAQDQAMEVQAMVDQATVDPQDCREVTNHQDMVDGKQRLEMHKKLSTCLNLRVFLSFTFILKSLRN
jgi:hypothetical protein